MLIALVVMVVVNRIELASCGLLLGYFFMDHKTKNHKEAIEGRYLYIMIPRSYEDSLLNVVPVSVVVLCRCYSYCCGFRFYRTSHRLAAFLWVKQTYTSTNL